MSVGYGIRSGARYLGEGAEGIVGEPGGMVSGDYGAVLGRGTG